MIVLFLAKISNLITLFAATSQADCDASQKSLFFGLPTWYEYLKVTYVAVGNGTCSIDVGNNPVTYGLIGLAAIDILLRLAGIVALGYFIWGGFKYITSQGEPENTKDALNTVLNSVIGLAIALVAAAIVSFIGHRLG